MVNGFDFHGRVALVTGGGKGIGACVVDRLRADGAKVAVFDRAPNDRGDFSIEGDVTSFASLRSGVAAAEAELGPLDVLVCAAGIFGGAMPTTEVSDELWDDVLAINTGGTHKAIKAVIPGMVERGYGRIVTIASIAAFEGLANGDSYAASKAAVVSVTRTVGRDLARTGVLVNCVVPALTETEMAAKLSPQQYEQAVEKIPMGRLAAPEEVATMAAFLASDQLSFSTGACFDVTGGRANY